MGTLDAVRQTEWVVYAKRPFAGPQQVVDYVGRYTHRVEISNSRLLDMDGGQVRFTYKDYMKVPRLCVLEKRRRDAGRQRVGGEDDRLRVIRNQNHEDAAEKFPGGFTRFDGAGGGFLEGGVDEAVPRAHRRQDPGAKPSPFSLRQRESAHPARIELQLLARLAIEHRNGRRRLPKLQLEDREAVQGGIRDLNTLPDERSNWALRSG